MEKNENQFLGVFLLLFFKMGEYLEKNEENKEKQGTWIGLTKTEQTGFFSISLREKERNRKCVTEKEINLFWKSVTRKNCFLFYFADSIYRIRFSNMMKRLFLVSWQTFDLNQINSLLTMPTSEKDFASDLTTLSVDRWSIGRNILTAGCAEKRKRQNFFSIRWISRAFFFLFSNQMKQRAKRIFVVKFSFSTNKIFQRCLMFEPRRFQRSFRVHSVSSIDLLFVSSRRVRSERWSKPSWTMQQRNNPIEMNRVVFVRTREDLWRVSNFSICFRSKWQPENQHDRQFALLRRGKNSTDLIDPHHRNKSLKTSRFSCSSIEKQIRQNSTIEIDLFVLTQYFHRLLL